VLERKPIFYDQERRRWRRTRRVLEITGALFTLVLIVFLIDLGRNPELPDILRPDIHGGLRPLHTRQTKKKLAAATRKRVFDMVERAGRGLLAHIRRERGL